MSDGPEDRHAENTDVLSTSARVPRTRRPPPPLDSLSSSERVPRTRRAVPRAGGGGDALPADNLSMSERVPRTKSKGFGRKMSKMLSRKSSGSGKE